MEYGFEREFFIRRPGRGETLCAVPTELTFLADGSGVLVEARGEPNKNPVLAAYLCKGAEFLLRQKLREHRLIMTAASKALVPLEELRLARRRIRKERVTYQNMRGLTLPPVERNDAGDEFVLAGLHVHFSRTYQDKGKTMFLPFDMMAIIQALDERFADIIDRAGRVPGMYEMKDHGFEYRSLPAMVDPLVVTAFINAPEFPK